VTVVGFTDTALWQNRTTTPNCSESSRRICHAACENPSVCATGERVLLAEEELVRHLHPPVKKLEKEFTLVNRFGLHVRPAAKWMAKA